MSGTKVEYVLVQFDVSLAQCFLIFTANTLRCQYSEHFYWLQTMGWYLVHSWFEWQQSTPNGKFPITSSRSWAGRSANIDWRLCVALESPQQMLFFARFHFPVYFKVLRHSSEVKGLRMESVLWERKRWLFLWLLGQRAVGANEEGAGRRVLLLVHAELLLGVKV